MCAVCGLPSSHSQLTQLAGIVSLFSFGLLTFLIAWWTVKSLAWRRWWSKFTFLIKK